LAVWRSQMCQVPSSFAKTARLPVTRPVTATQYPE
jgi:hypothetical protein